MGRGILRGILYAVKSAIVALHFTSEFCKALTFNLLTLKCYCELQMLFGICVPNSNMHTGQRAMHNAASSWEGHIIIYRGRVQNIFSP